MLRFRAFGIPVTVDTWFLLGMFFIFSLAGGGRPGTFAAVAIAVFTLVHELGHALTARHYGCAVEIRLNFLMGWAAFTSVRPLSRLERIVISLAGPLAGLGAGLITLAAIHTAHARAASPATQLLLADLWQGVAWAAIVISLLNLLPLWPLDGGHVVHKLIEAPLGERRSLRVMAIATLVGCAALVALSVLAGQRTGIVADWRRHGLGQYQNPFSHGLVGALWGSVTSAPSVVLGGIYFIPLVCGVSSMQLLAALKSPSSAGPSVGWVGVTEASGSRPAEARYDAAALAAEREGWLSGAQGAFPPGWGPSPWLRAWAHLRAGDTPGARMALAGVVSPQGRWIPPEPRRPELRSLVPLLPDPLPVGDARRSLDLLSVLGWQGSAEPVAHYATALYADDPDAEVLYRAAAGLAHAGQADAAMAWLNRAAQERPDADRLALDQGLAALHGRLDFQQLLVWSRSATPADR